MYCMGSGNFDVVQTALRNLPEYVLLCQGERRLFHFVIVETDPVKSSQSHACHIVTTVQYFLGEKNHLMKQAKVKVMRF